jgi:hypothetical protein
MVPGRCRPAMRPASGRHGWVVVAARGARAPGWARGGITLSVIEYGGSSVVPRFRRPGPGRVISPRPAERRCGPPSRPRWDRQGTGGHTTGSPVCPPTTHRRGIFRTFEREAAMVAAVCGVCPGDAGPDAGPRVSRQAAVVVCGRHRGHPPGFPRADLGPGVDVDRRG